MKLGKELLTAAIAILVLTVVLGVAYPLVMTGIAQVAFPTKADGSQIKAGGKVVGSRLIGQAFVIDTGKKDSDGNPITRPTRSTSSRGRRRPATAPPARSSPTAARTRPSGGSSSATSSPPTWRSSGRYDPGLTTAKVPVDAVTTSASGVDPHISQANARIQAHRIAAVRAAPARPRRPADRRQHRRALPRRHR